MAGGWSSVLQRPSLHPEDPSAPSSARASGNLRHLLIALLLLLVYFATAKLGLLLALVHPSATAVWPPTGISLAALLVLGYRYWPAVFGGAFLANLTTEGNVATSLGIATGNTLEAVVGALLVNRFASGRHAFERAVDIFKFIVLAGLVATTMSATIGVLSLSLGGFAAWSNFAAIWLTWWLGDVAGALVVAPMLILWAENRSLRPTLPRALELASLTIVLVAVAFLVFRGIDPVARENPPIAFLLLPVIAWAAFRFGRREAATLTFIVAGIAVWATVNGTGPFAWGSPNQSLLLVQAFVCVLSSSMLPTAAVAAEHRRMVRTLQASRDELEARVRHRTAELEASNQELESFAYSVAHDLRTPLRSIAGYSHLLLEDHASQLDAEGQELLRRVTASTSHMATLIEELLALSRVTRKELNEIPLNLTDMARRVAKAHQDREPKRRVEVHIQSGMRAHGDAQLVQLVMENLVGNAWKFTGRKPEPRIDVGTQHAEGGPLFFVRDNGAGFDMAFADKLFRPFQRLHSPVEFPGTGIGLATVQRIVQRHGGTVWAEGTPGQGATFYFTLRSGPAGVNKRGARPSPKRKRVPFGTSSPV